MGALDGVFSALAERLIDMFGTAVVITQNTDNVHDPVTGAVSSTSTPYSVFVSPPVLVGPKYVGIAGVRATDFKTFIKRQNLSFTPTIDMTLELDGTTYRIVRVDSLYEGENIAAYRMFFGV